jgi:hypothetical protein
MEEDGNKKICFFLGDAWQFVTTHRCSYIQVSNDFI